MILRRYHLYGQYTFSARTVIHKYTHTLKLFQWNRLIACVGFGCLARSPGGRKSSFFLWLFGSFLASPICVLQSLVCLAAARHFFFLVLNNLAVSIRTSFHLFFSFPAGLLHPRHHFRIRFQILLSTVPVTGSAHFYLSTCMQKGSPGS